MQIIETHAHIYLPEFDIDRQQLIEAAQAAGIEPILMPAIDNTTHGQMLLVEEQFSTCKAMMGLHPCSVKENYKEELQIVERYLQQRTFAAIGEIGLDFYWDTTFTKQQYEAFETQINWAREYNMPIVIHSRNAMDDCIEVVKKFKGVKGVFHCFSGSVQQAEQVIEEGFLLGIGGVATYKNAGLDKVLEQIGVEHLVLETDAPYLSPVPYRGKRNEPAYLTEVIKKVALATGKEIAEVAAITTENAIKIFKLS